MRRVNFKVNEYKDKAELISKKFNITEISSNILLNRNLETIEEIEEFLHPSFEYFESAKNYKDLEKGAQRIIEAIQNKERIVVYGDYDVDGVTSICQFVILLKNAGANISYYVPERESEGYGISIDFLEQLKTGDIDVDLIVTVDCGIAEVEMIKKINNYVKDVIILDHHECKDEIPTAYAVINPKQRDCKSKNKQLCAAGLTFKFLSHLNKFLGVEDVEEILLELACLGTIADIVELKNDNRIITYNGLEKINETKILGLKKLIEVSGIKGKIESYHIGYILAPRINAAGRMNSAKKAIELLLTNNEKESKALAQELENFNVLRKETEKIIFDEAVLKIETELMYKKNIIVVYGTNWHEGVLGIVASKLTERYEKPSVVISVKDGLGKGSARSLEYLDICEAFSMVDKYLIKYGGHKLAAGLTLLEENICAFHNDVDILIKNMITEENEEKELFVDAIISLNDVSYKLYNEISMFEPFGHENQRPVFAVKDASIKDLKRVGKTKEHLSFKLSHENKDIPVIGFSKINILEKVISKPSAFAFTISSNEFNGKENLQLVLVNVEESIDFNYTVDDQKSKIINALINKSKSKIIKTDIFAFVEKLNKTYNIKTTEEEVVCILKKSGNVQYVLKNEILYIKNN